MKRSFQPDLTKPTKIDWARLAAFLDGEGCISICSGGGNGRGHKPTFLRVFIANTDPRLIMWCQRKFGGSIRRVPRQDRLRHKPCWNWTVVSNVAVEILQGCMPYFIIKREQAEVGIAFQATKVYRGVKGNPKYARIIPEKVLTFRAHCYDELRRLKKEPPTVESLAVN